MGQGLVESIFDVRIYQVYHLTMVLTNLSAFQ